MFRRTILRHCKKTREQSSRNINTFKNGALLSLAFVKLAFLNLMAAQLSIGFILLLLTN